MTSIGEEGRLLDQILPSERQMIESVANAGAKVSVQAQAILSDLDKDQILRFPQQLPNYNSPENVVQYDLPQLMEQGEQKTTVYPNPSNGHITIDFAGQNAESIHVFDQTGRLVMTLAILDNQNAFDLSDLTGGIYTLVIVPESETIQILQIIVE